MYKRQLEKNAVEAEPTEDVREDLQTEEEEYKEELQEVPEMCIRDRPTSGIRICIPDISVYE